MATTGRMTPKEAFRFGFQLKCAEAGISPQELEKKATAGDIAALLALMAIPAFPAAGWYLGDKGGRMAAQWWHSDPFDVQDLQAAELAKMYRDMTTEQKLRSRRAALGRRKERQGFATI